MDKRYDHKIQESKIAKLWQDLGIFKFDKASKKEVFSIDTPPPTVSGSLHIGHVFSYTHTDFLARYHRMCGKNVFYPMGFDDNGLPTEKYVLKKRKVSIGDLSRSEYAKICHEETEVARGIFKKLWTNLGLSVDWDRSYSTISKEVVRISQHSFLDLYDKGLVERKAEPFLYCTACRTSVAQAELEWKEKPGVFNTIIFDGPDGQKLEIATTRPELLPACAAIFFHPDDSRYSSLEGKAAKTPIFGKDVKILPDSSVDPEKGTGLVMCCTFGDQADVLWHKKYELELTQAIGRDGKMTEVCGPIAGLKVGPAREKVIELLDQAGALKEQKEIVHGANTHDRCGKEVEFQTINQWFIKIMDHKDEFIKLADKIEWKPEHMKSRYIDWVNNLSWDWCISRQRNFGVPIPAWYCQKCDEVILAKQPSLPVDPQAEAAPKTSCPKCRSEKIVPEADVMDTWATSSLTPLIACGWPDNLDGKLFPMDIRPQAHDIIRTWAFYTIVKTHYHINTIPWKKIVISGHVLAGKEKISKSKDNAKNSPENLIETFSSDAVRFWAAGGRPGVDTLFDEAKLKNGQRTATKLWNAFRFISEHLGEVSEAPEKPKDLDALSLWLLHTLEAAEKAYHKAFEKDDYALALEIVERFFWHDFCDNYLEIVKGVMFNPEKFSSQQVESSRYAFFVAGLSIIQMYAPFMPFVTETLFGELFFEALGDKSIHATRFEKGRGFSFPENKMLIDKLIEAVAQARKLKSECELSLKTQVDKLSIVCQSQDLADGLAEQKNLIAYATNSKELVFNAQKEIEQPTAQVKGEQIETMTVFLADKE